jgi:LemA protein
MWELLIPVAIILGAVIIFNGLVKLRETVNGAWADIDVQLKRRHDLIPNIVSTVKGYAGHEKETLEAVVQARSAALSAQGPGQQAGAENMLTGTLKSLFALAENYPDLQAAEGFRDLQGTLSDLEGHIQQARRYYNAVVRDFNTKIGQVPSNIIARTFGFKAQEFFETEDAEREVPTVEF